MHEISDIYTLFCFLIVDYWWWGVCLLRWLGAWCVGPGLYLHLLWNSCMGDKGISPL